jgi:AcrR family transcriptional regulator
LLGASEIGYKSVTLLLHPLVSSGALSKEQNLPIRKQTYDSPRQLARRASILEATRDLLSKHGYDGTTVRDVAELAGVAKGTLYNIYGGKDELIFAAVNDVRADVFDRTMDLGPSPGIDIILKANDAVCEEVVRTPLYTEAISRALFGPSPAKMLIPSLVEFPINHTRDELEMAILLGQIESGIDTAQLARHLVMQRWGIIIAWTLGQISIDEVTPDVKHATVRILESVALPDTRAMLDKYLHDSR